MEETASELLIFDAKLKEERDYWIRRLGASRLAVGAVARAEPADGADGARGRFVVDLPSQLRDKLDALTKGSPFLLYTSAMAAAAVCLYKYSGGETAAVGSPPLKDLGRANALTILENVEARLSFQQLLLNVRATLLEAYANQRYPFARLIKDMKLDGLRRQGLFHIALAFDGLHGAMQDAGQGLTLTLRRGGDGLACDVEYDGALYARERAGRFVGHFVNVLDQGVGATATPVRDLRLMSDDEQNRFVREWNQTRAEYARGQCLHSLFERRAAESPDAAAVVFEDRVLTYGELNRWSNRLAHRLIREGIRPEARVGIYLRRSSEMIVALLAALKAGGAYLPLDHTYPKERLSFMMEDAGVAVLLTQRDLMGCLPAHGARVVCVEDCGEESDATHAENPSTGVTSDNLAYVIYTSGSTGRPKGAMVTHGGLVNYLSWSTEAYDVSGGRGTPVISPIGFDLTVTSIYPSLLAGRAVLLSREEKGLDGLADAVSAGGRLSLLKLTPSHMSVIEKLPFAAEVARRTNALIIGGEALRGESLSFWRAHNPDIRIVNEYGPTETVVGCCVYEAPRGETHAGAVPIGHPIANTQLYVLDRDMQHVPEDVEGELYVGGDGVGRGYLDRPSLTASRFLPDPFSPTPGARLYRTGDLVRRLADGALEYVGRGDGQVKVRGHRVELGEVESALLRAPGVRAAVVVARDGAGGGAMLVAYVVAGDGWEGAEGVRREAALRLPEYMRPSEVVELGELSLTENGKVDRGRLPEVAAEARRGGGECGSEAERVVAAVWGEVLGVEGVGGGDNFFELGGHSLLMAQMYSKVCETFKVSLPLQSFYESPTVAGVARNIEKELAARRAPSEQIGRAPRDGELPLSFAQQRFWFLDSLRPGNPAYNSYAPIRLTGRLNMTALQQAVDELVRRHESLRTIFPAIDGRPTQVIRPAATQELTVADLSGLPVREAEAEALRLTGEEARRPFSLAEGPLLRASVKRLGAADYIVQVTLHHIITDGVSNELLNREIVELYQAFSSGVPSPLEEVPIQYADFAQWQRGRLDSPEFRLQLAYWEGRLSTAPPPLDFAEGPRRLPPSPRGETHHFRLPRELAQALRRFSRGEGTTLFVTLLSAWLTLLHRYTGEDDIVVGSPAANRHRAEVAGMVGCLINTLALRADLSGGPSFRELVARLHRVVAEAQAHQEVPFELVMDSLRRGGRTASLFENWFVLQQGAGGTISVTSGGLRVRPVEAKSGAAQFDLAMVIIEEGEDLHGEMTYRQGVLSDEGAAEMVGHYASLLRALTERPEGGILDAELEGAGPSGGAEIIVGAATVREEAAGL